MILPLSHRQLLSGNNPTNQNKSFLRFKFLKANMDNMFAFYS